MRRRFLLLLVPFLAPAPAHAQAPLYGIGNGYYPNTGYGSPTPYGGSGYGGATSYGGQGYGQAYGGQGYGTGYGTGYGGQGYGGQAYGGQYGQTNGYGAQNQGFYGANPTYPGGYQPRSPDDVMTPGRVRTDSSRPNGSSNAPSVALPGATPGNVVQERKNPRGQRFEGVARVVDGNTLVMGADVLVLDGADAPELSQTCTEPGGLEWQCGKRSRDRLVKWVDGRKLVCVGTGFAGPAIAARCNLGMTDVGRAMVAEGWAVSPKFASPAYITDEAKAKADHRGVWAGTLTSPWTYRAKN